MFRSATFKLTVYYLGLVMVISLLFSSVLYHVASSEVATDINRQTTRIYNNFPVFDHSPLLRPSSDITVSRQRLLGRLVAFNAVVLVGAGFASYWLARRTLAPIEQAHEQQKRFTADVSHELRTPLTALKMESEVALLDDKISKPELRSVLQSNIEEATKLDTLINNLLRLTRLEAGELQQNFSSQKLPVIAAEAVEHISKKAAERGIKVVTTVHPQIIRGDYDSLVQLLVILLDNAVKYSPKGATVRLESGTTPSSVTVVDEGIGIEADAMKHVFDRFYRADASRSKTTSGFGLGLSIAKLIADVHQATITLTSRAGHGTTVMVSFPATAKNQGKSGPTATAAEKNTSANKDTKKV